MPVLCSKGPHLAIDVMRPKCDTSPKNKACGPTFTTSAAPYATAGAQVRAYVTVAVTENSIVLFSVDMKEPAADGGEVGPQ